MTIMEWKPIETAPKEEGVVVLVYEPGLPHFDIFMAEWVHDIVGKRWQQWNTEDPAWLHPTHWMPLPPPPDRQEGE